jgi:phage terminase large subunit
VTASKRKHVHQQRRARERRYLTFRGEVLRALKAVQQLRGQIQFPCVQYQQDPLGFVDRVLGVRLWSKQKEVLLALVNNRRVAVRSGQKIGKSMLAVCAALWFYCCFPGARVIFTSTTAAQVDRILWRQLRMVLAQALVVFEERPSELARTGMRALDFREIFGFSSKEAEAVAGISGVNLLYLADEASGIASVIYEAMQGNMMAGARLMLLGNPTKNDGEFFDAFHSKSEFYATFTISSEETPNCTGLEPPIPGLAEPEEIARFEREHGRESSWFKIRILGQHALQEDGRIFSIATITEAEQAWLPDDKPKGRLFIGIDPSGPSGTGDDAAFAPRIKHKVLEIVERKGLDSEGHLATAMQLIKKHNCKGLPQHESVPVVVLDGGGEYGVKVARAFREHLDTNPGAFVLVVLLMSDAATREVLIYDRMRDLLAGNLEQCFKAGLAIPTNAKLSAELHVFEWGVNAKGKQKLRPEKDGSNGVRRRLGRSPDRYDAVALSCWEPSALEQGADVGGDVGARVTIQDVYDTRTAELAKSQRSAWDGAGQGVVGDGNSASAWGHPVKYT